MTELADILQLIWSAVLDPWRSTIGMRALIVVLLIAPVSGLLGFWISKSQLTYATESLSHAVLPGMVAAALIGVPVLLGAWVAAVAAALLIAVIGLNITGSVTIVVTTAFAGGVVLAYSSASVPRLQELLFGDILGVTNLDLAVTAALVVVLLALLTVYRHQLVSTAFDRQYASTVGAKPAHFDLGLALLAATAVTVTVQVFGNLLAAAILLAPATTANLFRVGLRATVYLATAVAAASGVVGLYVSYYADLAAGASIALIAVLIFICVQLSFQTIKEISSA